MQFCLYRSECVFCPFDLQDLRILQTALSENSKNRLTGFLHRNKTHYFQYLEGPSTPLCETFEKIRCDRRHINLHVLLEGRTLSRRFSEWSMGYSQEQMTAPFSRLTEASTAETVIAFLEREAFKQKAFLDSPLEMKRRNGTFLH